MRLRVSFSFLNKLLIFLEHARLEQTFIFDIFYTPECCDEITSIVQQPSSCRLQKKYECRVAWWHCIIRFAWTHVLVNSHAFLQELLRSSYLAKHACISVAAHARDIYSSRQGQNFVILTLRFKTGSIFSLLKSSNGYFRVEDTPILFFPPTYLRAFTHNTRRRKLHINFGTKGASCSKSTSFRPQVCARISAPLSAGCGGGVGQRCAPLAGGYLP